MDRPKIVTKRLSNRILNNLSILYSPAWKQPHLHNRVLSSATTALNPCSNYTSLNAADRLESFTGQNPVRCDQRDITSGWYRFAGVAGNPKMSTTCPPVRRCGTHAPGWITGQHPSAADGEVTREVCYHWARNCCQWKNKIKVKNCGAFYVFELQKTPACSLRYCGECWRSRITWDN